MDGAEPTRFGDLLRRHRTAAGLTQEGLAERAGLSVRGIQDLERGIRRTPHSDTTRRLADALGLRDAERAGLLEAGQVARTSSDAADHARGMSALPSGTISFLFTDVESSTRAWLRNTGAMGAAVARHDALIERAVAEHGGHVVRPRGEGDSRFAVFARPSDALAAACAAQIALHQEHWTLAEPVRVRMAIHTGEADLRLGDYYGLAVNHCARLRAVAHGGQVVVSAVTADLVREALPTQASLRDLGLHQLKDLDQPERVWQLVHPELPADFPPLTSQSPRRHNLADQLSSFVGREREVVEVCGLLNTTRLLTLTGPGGSGKTRLALRVAAEALHRFPDGVWLVRLDAVADPRLVTGAVASTLGLREDGQRPLLETLQGHLQSRHSLIILDNCEHLVDASANLAASILYACPRLTILATSRRPLQVGGEMLWAVPPLTTPSPVSELVADRALVERLKGCDAIALFVERARAVRPSFQLSEDNATLVADICRRVDGLPLAIELAAARLYALTPRAMLDRMERRLPLLTEGPRDAPARQRTLRDTIAWSYDLLDSNQQALFRRVAIFRGCSIPAMEAVCKGSAPEPGSASIALLPLQPDLVDGMGSLVANNLVRHEELPDGVSWYSMLDTVREFALERLAESGELDAIQRRHILHYLDLAETAERDSLGPKESEWHARMEREQGNLRAALAASIERAYAGPSFRLTLALWWFWMVRGYISEGREQLGALLARFPVRDASGQRAFDRARALRAAATLASIQGDYAAARSSQEEGLAISRALGDLRGIASGLEGLVLITSMQADLATALRYAQESLEAARTIGDEEMIGHALNASANVHHELGYHAAARALAEESVEVLRQAGNPRQIAASLITLSVVAHDLGDLETERRASMVALADLRRNGDRRGEALVLANLGRFATERGDLVTARERLSESLYMERELGDASGVAFVLELFAVLAIEQANFVRAIELASAANALRHRIGAPLPLTSRHKLDHKLQAATDKLDAPCAAEAWERGEALGVEEAISLALQESKRIKEADPTIS
ncbi:MAG TPA: helix-turn-helix domain-containing protein [Chloroflexota bacterium]|nr:helix-turn-helix domain-containing protein [Chloroflexota bacterium]